MRRPSFKFAGLLLARLLFACGSYLAIPRPEDCEQEENISEAVFKQLLQMSEPQEYVQHNAVFISKEDLCFEDKFLARFSEQHNSVKLANHGSILWKNGAPFDARSGAPAIILHIGKVHWLNWRSVDVPAEYDCGVLCGYSAVFHLYRIGWKTWSVDSVSGRTISILFPNWLLTACDWSQRCGLKHRS
jgi:hypothetical protein